MSNVVRVARPSAKVRTGPPSCAREPLALDARLVEVDAMLDDGRAVRAHRGQLQRVRAARRHDRDRYAERLPGIRERLPMIAGRSRDDAVLRGGIATEEVEAAAHLERGG